MPKRSLVTNLEYAARVLGKRGGEGRRKALAPEERSKIAKQGGVARARSLTAEQRSKIAKLGYKAQKGKK